MIRLVAVCLALFAPPLRAEVLPALHDVTGVAADDVLNIRTAPEAGSAIIGTLAPDATGVEVIAVVDGWAVVNAGDVTGYASMNFLKRAAGPDWNALQSPMTCLGTEPFWSLAIDPVVKTARFQTPEEPEVMVSPIEQSWPGAPWAPAAAIALPEGLAVLYPTECSDGMSERSYGIMIDIFLHGAERPRLSGCCLLKLN